MYQQVKTFLEKNLSPHRFEHSLSTSRMCSYLANILGVDAEPAIMSGIAHDIAREITDDQKVLLASKDGYDVNTYESNHPVLVHGRAGAVMLQELFKIYDESILQAVRWHTTGHIEMGTIGKILFVSDYIEQGRKHIDEDYRHKLYDMTLDEMVLDVLSRKITYLRNTGNVIVQNSILLYDELLIIKNKNRGLKG